jgi:hypothetical protein
MWETLNCLPDAVEHMIHGDPDEPDSVKASDAVKWAIAEIARLREERLTAGEREAIQLALTLEWPHTSEQWEALAGCVGPVRKVPANKYKVAIGAFLARQPLPPGPEAAP